MPAVSATILPAGGRVGSLGFTPCLHIVFGELPLKEARVTYREGAMDEVQKMLSEKIYEFELDITRAVDYGVKMDAILSGKEKAPLRGTRLDVARDEQRAT